MKVLVLGGTGSIGAPVVRELVSAGHQVTALARSERSAAALEQAGASPLPGDLRKPEGWVNALPPVDAVVHAASDFSDEMEAVDRQLLDALLPALGAMPVRPRLVYTGGCWLYGATGDRVATEETPFDPLLAFAWSVPMIERVLRAPQVDARIIHPGMVYTADGGVVASFIDDAKAGRRLRIVGAGDVHWPLVHADDLATLYRLVLERGAPGEVYNGATVDGLPVALIAGAVARHHGGAGAGLTIVDADAIAAELGEWARGYGLDQRMSGGKARRDLGWRPVHADPLASLALPG